MNESIEIKSEQAGYVMAWLIKNCLEKGYIATNEDYAIRLEKDGSIIKIYYNKEYIPTCIVIQTGIDREFKTDIEKVCTVEFDKLDQIRKIGIASSTSSVSSNTAISTGKHGTIHIYVDGSGGKDCSWAYTHWDISKNKSIKEDSGKIGPHPQNNVIGEVEAVIRALEYVKTTKSDNVEIYYDYVGIENWATKIWTAKTEVTKAYVEKINDFIKIGKKINFVKVIGHTGIQGNEYADQLCTKAKANKLLSGLKVLP